MRTASGPGRSSRPGSASPSSSALRRSTREADLLRDHVHPGAGREAQQPMSIRILGQGDGEESAEDRIFPISPLTVMEIPNLTVNATSSGTSGQAPFTASMSAVTDGGVGPFTYTWDFGDGHTGFSSSPSCNYTYSTNGNYTATCWVSDSKGQTANDSITFNVTSSLGNDVSGWIGPLIIVGIIAVIVAVIAVKFVVARKK